MRVLLTHGIDDLESDMRGIAARSQRDMLGVVKEGVRVGNSLAKDFARRSSGGHGRHYPGAFSAEIKFAGFGAFVGEYGPVESAKQGDMSFEEGSRNQKPHRDLARSLDIVGPAFRGEVRRMAGGYFW